MQKEPSSRSEKEYDRVIALLQGIDFFKQNKQLSYSDYRELAQLMTYVEFDRDQFVYKSGDTPENFYVILNGQIE